MSVKPRPIYQHSPERVWMLSGRYAEDGTPLWVSRPWALGERAEYIRTVLRREPYTGER